MGFIKEDFAIHFANLNVGNEWRTNLAIGSKIKLKNDNTIYIFYGYNNNKTIASCFPANANTIIEDIKYISITEIDILL